MIQILLHSSKTMRRAAEHQQPLGSPQLLAQAEALIGQLRPLTQSEVESLMNISPTKAAEARAQLAAWSTDVLQQIPAVDAFIGDIYSGLQVQTWNDEDRVYAHQHLLILSGLYGGLRACDGILPYRFEMGYKLPDGRNMYTFWNNQIAALLPASTTHIINLSAVEYTKAVLPYTDVPVIAPKFLTVSPKTGEPTFVTVHAKIARGAFARWLIQHKINDVSRLSEFSELGYKYDQASSTPEQPVFVCNEFKGIGLSVRLT